MERCPDDANMSSGICMEPMARPQAPAPPWAEPETYTGLWRRSRARSADVTTKGDRAIRLQAEIEQTQRIGDHP